ncbi:hypothetical protein ['Camptotheca acuminata' phytoplasma]|uniref:hypothetical protein n=1 Tax='Camptotheca acuminata' phytoplasma TaxID=3239192 RepID=UPI00351A9ED9
MNTFKYTLKTYLDNDLGKNLLFLYDYDKYILEYRLKEKDQIFNSFFETFSTEPLKIKLYIKKDISPNKINEILNIFNKEIFLLPPKYIEEISCKDLKNLYGNKSFPLLSYGKNYRISEFEPQNMKLILTDLHHELKNIVYLGADKKTESQLFKDNKISRFSPLEDIMKQIDYDEQDLNRVLLNNDKYQKEFKLDSWQFFIGFNLATKKNYLKSKIKEQLEYFSTYYKNKQDNKSTQIIEEGLNQINSLNDYQDICEKYKQILRKIFSSEDKLLKYINELDKWLNYNFSHQIIHNPNFRKSLYLAFDRQQMINDIFPFL